MIPIYTCKVDENDTLNGILGISFVKSPAVETNFVALKKQDKQIQLKKDVKKHILTGVILIPEQLIYRQDEDGSEYFIKFSKDDIEKISQKMMKTGVVLTNTTHEHEKALSGNYLTESWISVDEQKDKSVALGFEGLPVGTLFASYKIEDNDYWDKYVETGEVQGFSLEGFFDQVRVMEKQEKINKNNTIMQKQVKNKKTNFVKMLKKYFLEEIENIEEVIEKDTVKAGEAVIIFLLYDQTEVIVDEDGFCSSYGYPFWAGKHKLYNGDYLIIDEDSMFVGTESATGEEEEEVVTPATVEPSDEEKLSKNNKKENMQKNKTHLPLPVKGAKVTKVVKPVTKLAEEEVEEIIEEVETLEDKFAKLEDRVKELEDLVKEKDETIEEKEEELSKIKKVTPSVQPVIPTVETPTKKLSEMKRHERIAYQLSIMNNKKEN
ncbi:hypothetical protein EZS27_004652 [termite gut metagenome]|uniref:Phage-like element PBSX protein XkdF domain-containing protein n=1 Tax=termite gut metagenome TaxID=433724 RepID=A0A5J4SPY4_9ZZZZ